MPAKTPTYPTFHSWPIVRISLLARARTTLATRRTWPDDFEIADDGTVYEILERDDDGEPGAWQATDLAVDPIDEIKRECGGARAELQASPWDGYGDAVTEIEASQMMDDLDQIGWS